MAKAPKLPEGRILKAFKGADALKKLVPVLREKAFTGYLRVAAEGRPDVGYMLFRDGKQVQAYVTAADGVQAGTGAMVPLRELSRDDGALIEVHVDVDLDPFLSEPEGKRGLSRGFDALRQKLDEWRSQGGDGEGLEDALEGDLPSSLGSFKERAQAPKGHWGVDEDIRDLASPSSGRTVVVEEVEERPDPAEPSAREEERPRPAPAPTAPPAKVDAGTGLRPDQTFDTLLVGDYNRFAHAAGAAIAEGAVEPYNPLFIVGSPGLGKTHLLHAIGNRTLERDPDAGVRYLTASRYWSELQEADRAGTVAEFRRRFHELDLLLVDDAQDIEARDRVQEELFELFESYRREGKALVLVADRYPSGLRDVDPRLVSRLESGLVADLKVPDAATRYGYLELLVRRRDADCPKTVLRYLADRYTVDMRALEGALNRVLAYGTALGRRLDLPTAKEALGEEEAPPSSVPDAPSPERAPDLVPGRSYLLMEERPDASFRLFARRAQRVRGLLISRTNPARLREDHGMDGADLLWLTDRADSEERTVEPSLERVLHRMESFMVSGGQGIMMLDGLEFLKSSNSFEAVLKFLRRLVDEIAESDFTFALTLNPATLEERELRVLQRELEPVGMDSGRSRG